MNTKDYFKNMYTDFYGVENNREIKPVKEESKSEDELMSSLFDEINNLLVTDESKDLLKKIIEYMRKYHEGIEKNYIPFRLIIETNNTNLNDELNSILSTAGYNFKYINSSNIEKLSLYKIPNPLKLNNERLISITDLTGLNNEEDKNIKNFFYELTSYLKNDDHNILSITGTNLDINSFFLGRENIKNTYFDFQIKGINPDIQDVYNIILDNTNLDEEKQVSLLDYLSKTYNKNTDYITYKNELIKYISFNKDIPTLERNKTEEEIFAELNELVGLKKVKQILHELVDMISLKEKTGKYLNIKDINLHMVFLGNPGTGKTTIARLIANILYNLGYIKENKLVEVSIKDLVAEYVGQTAPKTMSVIEKSMNGVLFIDEAYALASKDGNSYNSEAIATLIQAMENYRDSLVVIFAGYTKEMQDFLNSNSGITSRIGYTLEFDDYTTDELLAIFKTFTDKAGFEVTDEAMDYLRKIVEKYRNMKNFGNARFMRNIYEKSIIKHAANVKTKKQRKVLKTITKEDISIENLILE